MSDTQPEVRWWSAIATSEPDSSGSDTEDDEDTRPTEKQSREFNQFCTRMQYNVVVTNED